VTKPLRSYAGLKAITLIGLLQFSLLCTAGSSASYEQLLQGVESSPFGAKQCQDLAVTFGEWVVQQRDDETEAAALLEGRRLGERLHGNCRSAIREIERVTNEDEAALEALYRSELWYDLNRALASLRYWQAWLDLSLAQHAPDKETRVTALSRAERGFQASSLRILYPGLVYGSWLGLSYVAQLQEDTATMKQRLLLLERALQSDPDNPLHEIVQTELTLLAMQSEGNSTIQIVDNEPLTSATARLLEEQAFVLLQIRREENTGGFKAAENLRQLVDQGFLDDRLFARILSYRDEIVGFELGNVSYLLEAEYGYAFQQYNTAVLKFRAFLASDAVNLPLDLSVFSYHYAVALYEIGLYRDSMLMIEELFTAERLPVGLQAPLIKLRFIVSEAMYQEDPSTFRASLLESAAQAYVASAGSDPDVASAHLALARVGSDSEQQALHLSLAAADSRLEGNVLAVELELAVSRFQQAAGTTSTAEIAESAAQALSLLESLPDDQRETLAMQVLAVQLESVLVEEPIELLEKIDTLSLDPLLDPTQRRVLLWSRLRLIDRLQGQDALRLYVQGRAGSPDNAFDHEMYVLLREFDAQRRHADLAGLSELWLPTLVAKPQLQRQVWMLHIGALRATRRHQESLDTIHNMLAVFPTSGDAWEQLAEQTELMGDTFAAERALAHIAAAEPEGSPRWIEVSLHRLRLLGAADTRDTSACSLEKTIRVYNHRLSEEQQQDLAVLSDDMDCSMGEE
jgi:hypothetical protein